MRTLRIEAIGWATVFMIGISPVVFGWGGAAGSDKSGEEKTSAQAKSTQSQPQTQAQTQTKETRGEFTIIKMKPEEKNTTTISTPDGLEQNNLRRLEIYNKVKEQIQDEQLQSEEDAEKSENEEKPPKQ